MLSRPLFLIHQLEDLETEVSGWGHSCPSYLSHQPQNIFGVLNAMLEVLDGFLHSVGFV